MIILTGLTSINLTSLCDRIMIMHSSDLPGSKRRFIWICVLLGLSILAAACSPGQSPTGLAPGAVVTKTSVPLIILETNPIVSPERTALPSIAIQHTPSDTPVPEQTRPAETAGSVPGASATAEPSALPTSPIPPEAPVFGIELDAVSEQGGVNLVTEAGAYWVRRNALLWSDVEYLPGQRNWQNLAHLEEEFKTASEKGLQLILVVRSTPPFARQAPNSACSAVAKAQFEDFAEFMFDAVTRYSQPPFNVLYWELGNEPDVDPAHVSAQSVYGCWGDLADPYYGGRHYAEMLKVVYPRIKAANPQAQLLVGGLLLDCDPDTPPENPPGSANFKDCSSGRYLEGILEAGGGAYFDAVSFHAYDYYAEGLGWYGNLNWFSTWITTGPVLQAKAAFLNDLLARYGWGDKPLMNTEVGLICASSPAQCALEEFELTKAYYAAQVNASALAEGLKANIWYSLAGWRDSGLVGPGRAPRLALTAYGASTERLEAAAATGALALEEGLMGFGYERQGTLGWVVWAVDDAAHQVPVQQTPSRIFDVFGVELEISNPVEVGVAPVYIEWEP